MLVETPITGAISELIEAADNRKLLLRAESNSKRDLITRETRVSLRSDLKSLQKSLPSNQLIEAFSFFYYLRTESISPVSGVKEMYQYFAQAATKQTPISVITWDCPGCAEPYVVDGEITRDPLDSEAGAKETLLRRRFVTRSELAIPLLQTIDQIQQSIPINFFLITAGLNAQTYYPKSVETAEQQAAALTAVGLFTREYQVWANTAFGKLSFPVVPDLSIYPLKSDSRYWQIYRDVMQGKIPIPEFVLKKQMEINERITQPLGLNNSPQAQVLAKRVIASYAAEGVILEDLKPKLGNIIIAATEAVSVYFQRTNFVRRYLGLKPIPTFYTLYD